MFETTFCVLHSWLTLNFWIVNSPFLVCTLIRGLIIVLTEVFPYLRLFLALNCMLWIWDASQFIEISVLLSHLDDKDGWEDKLFCCRTLLVVKAACALLIRLAGLGSVVWWKPLPSWQRFKEGQLSLRYWLVKQAVFDRPVLLDSFKSIFKRQILVMWTGCNKMWFLTSDKFFLLAYHCCPWLFSLFLLESLGDVHLGCLVWVVVVSEQNDYCLRFDWNWLFYFPGLLCWKIWLEYQAIIETEIG